MREKEGEISALTGAIEDSRSSEQKLRQEYNAANDRLRVVEEDNTRLRQALEERNDEILRMCSALREYVENRLSDGPLKDLKVRQFSTYFKLQSLSLTICASVILLEYKCHDELNQLWCC